MIIADMCNLDVHWSYYQSPDTDHILFLYGDYLCVSPFVELDQFLASTVHKGCNPNFLLPQILLKQRLHSSDYW